MFAGRWYAHVCAFAENSFDKLVGRQVVFGESLNEMLRYAKHENQGKFTAAKMSGLMQKVANLGTCHRLLENRVYRACA